MSDTAIDLSEIDTDPKRMAARLMQMAAALLARCTTSADRDRNLSVKEAAERMGVSVSYLYQNHGKLPFTVKIGSRLLFSSDGIAKWLRRQQGKIA